MAYPGTTDVLSGFRQKNNGTFPLVDSHAVYVDDNTRLDDKLASLQNGKVDEPSTEGSSGQVLATDGSGGRYWRTVSGGGSGGTSDYLDLENKPQIGGITLSGNKSLSDLGIASESAMIAIDNQVSALDQSVSDLAAAIAGELVKRTLYSKDCFSDTTYMVGDEGSIYIHSSAPSIYSGPYTHLGIRATKLIFTHDFLGKSNSDEVWVGFIIGDDVFVGYPLSDATSYMRAFTSGGTQTSFTDGNVTTRGALTATGVYTIEAAFENNTFTIKTGDNVLFEMAVNSGVEYKGIGVLRFSVSYARLLYDCSVLPMPEDEEEEKIENNEGSSIAAEYYLKGNASKAARTKKLCIIGAGQSNIDGYVPIADLPSGYSLPMSGMKYIKNSTSGYFTNNYPSVDMWSFDVVLCKLLIDNLGADNLYYIKYSEGGTSIDPASTAKPRHWTADYEQLSDISNSLLYSFETEIRKCEEINPGEYEIRAMIWHQGETDAARESPTASKNYYGNLKKVIAYCRGVVGNARLPFVFGTVAHANYDYDESIEAAMHKIAEEDPYVWLVDMSNAELRDQWHFNASWSEYMGKKYYDCLIDAGVITGQKLNPSEPVT